jgi:hypothetical protein
MPFVRCWRVRMSRKSLLVSGCTARRFTADLLPIGQAQPSRSRLPRVGSHGPLGFAAHDGADDLMGATNLTADLSQRQAFRAEPSGQLALLHRLPQRRHQMVLFAAALTATSTAGRPADLAAEGENDETPAAHGQDRQHSPEGHASGEDYDDSLGDH